MVYPVAYGEAEAGDRSIMAAPGWSPGEEDRKTEQGWNTTTSNQRLQKVS